MKKKFKKYLLFDIICIFLFAIFLLVSLFISFPRLFIIVVLVIYFALSIFRIIMIYYVGTASVLVHNACKPTSPVKVSDKALKNVDAHALKQDFVPKREIAHFDIFKDTAK